MSRYVTKAQRLIEKQDEFYRGKSVGKQEALKEFNDQARSKILQHKLDLLDSLAKIIEANAQMTSRIASSLEDWIPKA